jgi:hypothetical protein
MSMPPYLLICYQPGCGKIAQYKIAARWSDGITEELKTYGLTCEGCLKDWFLRSQARHQACRRAPGEKLGPPAIFALSHGQRDRQLQPRPDLEQKISSLVKGLS